MYDCVNNTIQNFHNHSLPASVDRKCIGKSSYSELLLDMNLGKLDLSEKCWTEPIYRDETELLYSLYFALHYDLVRPVFIKWIFSSSVNAPHPSAYAGSGFWLNTSYKRSTKSYLIVIGNT